MGRKKCVVGENRAVRKTFPEKENREQKRKKKEKENRIKQKTQTKENSNKNKLKTETPQGLKLCFSLQGISIHK
jgi:hemolysin activation/secretion protein